MERSPLIPSLHVPDVVQAVTFYTDILGFRQTGTWDENAAPLWAEVTRDTPKGPARLWFFSNAIEDRPGPMLSGLLYVFVDDVDAEADRLRDAVTIRWGPEDMPYGLREVGIEDLNGYLLCLATDL